MGVTDSDPAKYLPTSVQKSYFMLTRSARDILDTALQKYRPGRTDLILVGGLTQLKPALRLLTAYRLVIEDVTDTEALTSYTRWLECVQVKEGSEPEVYVAFSPRFEHLWLESKKRFPDYMDQKPANTRLRSQYSLRLYSWAKKHVESETKSISVEQLRKVMGLEPLTDADGTVIQDSALPIWANFRQRALDLAIAEISKKTDLKIEIKSLDRAPHRRVTGVNFTIKTHAIPKAQV